MVPMLGSFAVSRVILFSAPFAAVVSDRQCKCAPAPDRTSGQELARKLREKLIQADFTASSDWTKKQVASLSQLYRIPHLRDGQSWFPVPRVLCSGRILWHWSLGFCARSVRLLPFVIFYAQTLVVGIPHSPLSVFMSLACLRLAILGFSAVRYLASLRQWCLPFPSLWRDFLGLFRRRAQGHLPDCPFRSHQGGTEMAEKLS